MKSRRLEVVSLSSVGRADNLCDYIRDRIIYEATKTYKDFRTFPIHFQCVSNDYSIKLTGKFPVELDYLEIINTSLNNVGYSEMEVQMFETEQIDYERDLCGLYTATAVAETDDYTTMASHITRALLVRLEHEIFAIKDEIDPLFRPDARVKLSMVYDEKDNPISIDTIDIKVSHDPGVDVSLIREILNEEIIQPIVEDYGFEDIRKIYLNSYGPDDYDFSNYGPFLEMGCSGKSFIDCNGTSLVRKSGNYMARYIAKNIVASDLAMKCTVNLNYIQGYERPQFISVNTYGTGKVSDAEITRAVQELFDLTTEGIAQELGLYSGNVDYSDTAIFGYYGEWSPFKRPWEQTNKVKALKAYCKQKESIKDIDIWKK